MAITIIKTPERKPYRDLYHAFIEKHFTGDFELGLSAFTAWSDSPFYFSNTGLNDKREVKSYASMIVTTQATYQALRDGKIKEHEIMPLEPGSNDTAALYWPSLIIEERQQGPYLIKSIFRELENVCRDWELHIKTVYAIGFTKVSERILKRYGFTQVGLYGGKYPIMAATVADNPYLRAFII